MFYIQEPTKKLKDICALLGDTYSIRVIDGEQVIYRKLNDNFDIEVSGLNNNRNSMKALVYIWRLRPGKSIVESVSDITSFESLKSVLMNLAEKYQNLNQ